MTDRISSPEKNPALLDVHDLNVRFAHEAGALHAVRGVSFFTACR